MLQHVTKLTPSRIRIRMAAKSPAETIAFVRALLKSKAASAEHLRAAASGLSQAITTTREILRTGHALKPRRVHESRLAVYLTLRSSLRAAARAR